MKITKIFLKKIIKEEINKLLIESNIPPPPKGGPAKEREDLPPNPNEHDMIEKVKNSDLINQAILDMRLHDDAQGTGRFDKEAEQFLENDKNLKKNFILAITGKITDKNKIKEIISGIEADQNIHMQYIHIQPLSYNTGTIFWHKSWVQIYDRWISALKEKIKNMENV